MSFELLGRVQKEFSITSHALYETVLAISERVNRKVQIMRLHWQATTLLARIDEVTNTLGQQIAASVAPRSPDPGVADSALTDLDTSVSRSHQRVQELKRELLGIDAEIRQLKLETIHDDLLRLQQDLSMRSAGIERVTILRGAAAVGRKISDVPRSSSIHVATVMRGPFLLAPDKDLVFRTGDIVVLLGGQTELDPLTNWFTSHRRTKAMAPQSA
ncbi:TrkA C-terminal domain-containing protein [Nitrospira sp. NS4]|uniref:TrkA C-terminal domain-containing protein n=1 Tax=Nitrospira sp. NS4 TaxID=3414498 RepID=UPI003C2E9D1D